MELDELKKRLLEKGVNPKHMNSKTFEKMLLILVEAGEGITGIDLYKKQEEFEKECERRTEELDRRERIIDQKYERYNQLATIEDRTAACVKEGQEILDEYKANIQNVIDIMYKCETEEGRDKFRLAQLYINSVDVGTKYDNTAFIIGLASILSRPGNMDPINELVKINPKIPNVKLQGFSGGHLYLSTGARL